MGDLAGNKFDAAQRRLVIEQNAAGRMHSMALTVVHGGPMRHQLGHAIGTPRVKRCGFVLALRLDKPEHLAGGCLVEARFPIDDAHGLKHVDGAHAGDLCCQHRLLPGAADEALRRKVVDLSGS